jgi:hypothetical protein
MGDSRRVEEGFASTQKEILAEKAAALARIARTLESHVERLGVLREELRTLPAPARAEARLRYEEARQTALRWRWYLEVQREAMGLLRHERLDELYPIDPAPD